MSSAQRIESVGWGILTGHEQDEVDEKQPVAFQSHFALVDESLADVRVGGADFLTFDVGVRLTQV